MNDSSVLPCKRRRPSSEPGLRRVLIIYTGGTIGMKPTPRGYAPEPGFLTSVVKASSNLTDTGPDATELVPEHLQAACAAEGREVFVTPVSEFEQRCIFSILEYEPLLDSSNMQISEWRRIANDVRKYYDDWDAFVILHGTDTMAYTASILSFMFQNLSKTVVLTGSQIPLCRPRNDGLDNLLGAMDFAAHFEIPEVVLYFANALYRGCRTSKVSSSQLEGFGSPNLEPLATVGIGFTVRWPLVRSPCAGKFEVQDCFCSDVTILRIYPGKFTTLRSFLTPLKGVVMQTFGAGNAPDNDPDFLSALKEATERGCVIVNITQCIKGEVKAHYAAGTALLEAGVTPGGDMTPEAALTKLGWLLGSGRSPSEIRKLMVTNLRGEVTESPSHMRFSLQDAGFARAVANVLASMNKDRVQELCTSNSVSLVSSALLPTLMCAAAARGDLPELQAMLRDGVSADQTDYDRRTPLHLACCEGQAEAARFLLEQRADINAVDRFGRTPLNSAIASQNVELVEHIRDRNGVLGESESELASKLCRLAREKNVSELSLWRRAGANISAADYDDRTALHLCAEVNDIEAAEMLLASRADPMRNDRFGGCPLSIANKHGHKEMSALFQCRQPAPTDAFTVPS
eukprot:TRINITY_DN92708_c0_g1_i1.p1 TRINITY_DN92708_c0_g1~~TRINITY_DN92708_c0_g1_i1.p1  ORF type:complete len:630 (+),score=76.77 TRINITY_DN92708_c0_g1_i1:25-1914(+)